MSKTLDTSVSAIRLKRATCVHLTRKDGTDELYTDHDLDLTFSVPSIGSSTFLARAGFTRSADQSAASLEVGRVEVRGPLLVGGLDGTLLRNGGYDNAVIRLFETDWSAPVYGDAWLKMGWLGEIRLEDDVYVAEIVGMEQPLSRKVVELYTPDCQADLGDTRCQVALGAFTVTGTVSSATSQRVFDVSSAPAAPGGLLTWTSGLNNGLAMDVHAISGAEITLFRQMPFGVQVGDGYSAYRGCDKLFATCRDVFSNVVNFRGHGLYVPGRDSMTASPLSGQSEAVP